MIRVVKVNGLRTPEQRAGVCYVGRGFAGWPNTPWGNPFPVKQGYNAVEEHRKFIGRIAPAKMAELLEALWQACDHGVKPLGCWCTEATTGDGKPVVCHGQTWAMLLYERFFNPNQGQA